MLQILEKRNVRLGNTLDVDMKITKLQNVQSHQYITRNNESNYFLMKKVIVHATTAKITVTKIYMHLWHVCMAMTNVQIKKLVTVRNLSIRFWILEQYAT